MKRKLYTLVFVIRDDRILLGMKKRGFGAGRWNGFGGKVETGESIQDAARRETKEECGIEITAMELAGRHEFRFTTWPDEVLEAHVFRAIDYEREPIETEEMRPEWFPIEAIPYDTMWPDDRYWFPVFLAGKKFRTKFLFGEGDVLLEQDIQVVEKL